MKEHDDTSFDPAGLWVSDCFLRHASFFCYSQGHLRRPNWNLTMFVSKSFALNQGIFSSSVKLFHVREKSSILSESNSKSTFFIWDIGRKRWKRGIAFLIHDPKFDVQLRLSKLMFTVYATHHRWIYHRISQMQSTECQCFLNHKPFHGSTNLELWCQLRYDCFQRTSVLLSLTYSSATTSSKPLYWTYSAQNRISYVRCDVRATREALRPSTNFNYEHGDDRRCNL